MSYEKHTWETGETITAEKLNNLENGVASGGGGSDLPEVTAEDNGDVLTVVEGTWAKASPSGSGVLVPYIETGLANQSGHFFCSACV